MLKDGNELTEDMIKMVRIAVATAIKRAGNLVEIDPDAVELGQELRIGEATLGRDLSRCRALSHQLRDRKPRPIGLHVQIGKLRLRQTDRRELCAAALVGLFLRSRHVLSFPYPRPDCLGRD
jgi:hypothetical protein